VKANLANLLKSGLACPEGRSRIEYVDSGDGSVPGLFIEARSTSPGVGTWYLRYRPRDSRTTTYQRLGSTRDLGVAQARTHARKLRAEIALGGNPRRDERAKREAATFGEVFAEYMKFARPRKRSAHSDETLYRVRLEKQYGHRRVNELTRKELIEFHSSLLNDGLAPATADHYLKLVRRVIGYGCELGMVDKNPAAKFPLFNPDNRVNHFLNDEELARLLHVLNTDANRMICRFVLWLLATGCRYSEAIKATWKDIDRQNRRWLIPQQHSKNRKSRWAALNDLAFQILDELDTDSYPHLFVNRATGKPYVSTKKVWERLRREAGLPHFRLHDCRHQHASMLANRGVSLLTIKEQLGHADIRMTANRYSHIAPATMAAASQVAADAMKEAMRALPSKQPTHAGMTFAALEDKRSGGAGSPADTA